MPKTKGPFDDDIPLLYPDNHSVKFSRFTQSHYETPIIKGVASQLGRWPTDLLFAFAAACLIIASLIILIFVTVAFCLPNTVDSKWRIIENFDVGQSHNVYFLKLENRTWSTREFCYIETAARKYPELNVYLINLLNDEFTARRLNERFESKQKTDSKFFYSLKEANYPLLPEEQLRNQLVSRNTNIRDINVSIRRFFKGSELSNIANSLSNEMLELAAKAQLLWNSPGIIINPNTYCNLEIIEKLICNGSKQNCVPDKLATIEPNNDVQATGVPCQAFVGYLMHKISKAKLEQRYALKEIVEEYCPRQYYCPEVRILDALPKCSATELNCPIVYSTTILQNEPNVIPRLT